MPLVASQFNRFQKMYTTDNAPSAGAGVSCTPGNNSKGTYVSLIAGDMAGGISDDIYGVMIRIVAGATSAASRNILVDIGVDPAGGTSYSVLIPDLLGSCAEAYVSAGGGICYYFPLRIRSGSTMAVRASVNNATVGSVKVIPYLFAQPSHPWMTRCGSVVDSFGITAASSSGTAITPGSTGAEGTYVQLGSNTGKSYFWWQVGMGIANATMAAVCYHIDLAAGDGTNKDLLIQNRRYTTSSAESLSSSFDCPSVMGVSGQGYREIPSGVGIYARGSCSSTTDTGISAAAWAVY